MRSESVPHSTTHVKLDGLPIEIPSERRSLAGICSFLEAVALQQQRILCSVIVDGESINLTQPDTLHSFASVEAETMSLKEVPVQLVKAALQQTVAVRARVQSAVGLVLINEGEAAHELWWNLAVCLKEPLLTLSLLPDDICGTAEGQASLTQLRKWQLQQLGAVIQYVNNACEWNNPVILSDALEIRVLPWLENLHASLNLWHETVLANTRVANTKSRHAC